MKNVFFLLVLICGTVALIGSCAQKDDTTTTTTTATALVASSTASGSITVGSETLSGTYATSCYTAGVVPWYHQIVSPLTQKHLVGFL